MVGFEMTVGEYRYAPVIWAKNALSVEGIRVAPQITSGLSDTSSFGRGLDGACLY
jgi:hypothetical protein